MGPVSDDDARGKASPPEDAGDGVGDGLGAPRPVDPPAEAVIEVDATVPVEAPAPRDIGDVALLALIDRLAALLDRSDLTELEVEAGGTGLVLRKPAAILAPSTAVAVAIPDAPAATAPSAAGEPSTAGRDPATTARPSVKAPLTGIFYASPAPGSAPYVQVGGEIAVGQIIGLIEAMKLFNEIKSDLAGRVVKVIPESGTLVKAKQPLLEVEPL
jgi:acetyl-CoA carboxylase biotin carboxyl carrier protein